MKYSEIKLGQTFRIINDDDKNLVTEGKVIELSSVDKHLTIQFDDEFETYAWGLPHHDIRLDGLTLIGE